MELKHDSFAAEHTSANQPLVFFVTRESELLLEMKKYFANKKENSNIFKV